MNHEMAKASLAGILIGAAGVFVIHAQQTKTKTIQPVTCLLRKSPPEAYRRSSDDKTFISSPLDCS
jgi:hypothetical protein